MFVLNNMRIDRVNEQLLIRRWVKNIWMFQTILPSKTWDIGDSSSEKNEIHINTNFKRSRDIYSHT